MRLVRLAWGCSAPVFWGKGGASPGFLWHAGALLESHGEGLSAGAKLLWQWAAACLLQGLQLLINLLPNTPQTVGILNQSLFARMKAGAYIINLARGVHLDQDALLAALDNGQVAAATLDVFDQEPLAADHPFWQHPRVTMTPHIAAITLPQVAMDYIADNIHAIEAGRRPEGG